MVSKVKRRQMAQAQLLGLPKRRRPFRPKQLHQTHRTPSQWDTVYDKAAKLAYVDSAWDITGLSGQELMQVQDVLTRGLNDGWSERSFARVLRPIIGLGPKFDAAVAAYQVRLSQQGRSKADVQRLTAAYADRLGRYRAKLVAEYELRTALGRAQRGYWRVWMLAQSSTP